MSDQKIHFTFSMLIAAAMAFFGIQFAQADETKPMLRIICASALSEQHKIVIASKNENGKWKELANTELRSAMVSGWLPAKAGELHLVEKKDGEMKSIAHFTYPEGASRAMVALISNPKDNTYTTHALNPEKESYIKGASLILNLSTHTANITLGTDKLVLEAGKDLTAKPTTDENGGYRLMVSYTGSDGVEQLCYDRMAIPSPNARNILFLLPDETVSLRVLTLSEFGPFE